ncbi:zinc finger protein Xfin [Lutzomyia longipalpis]|uniref:zinc finger protein Xfin n=1 Tax=Lutzomyia longipalpis TaxID=7200 RepID=UPI0024836395|nr:zinc finger protein Xfin [Lutzomyia longipalpis]
MESDSIDDMIVYDEDSIGETVAPPDVPERPDGEKTNEKCIVANMVSMYQCQECNAVVSTAEEFLSHHQIMHSGSREVMVEFMKDGVQAEPDSDVDVKYVCSLCYGVFESVQHTRDHMIVDHRLKEVGAKEDPGSSAPSNPSSDSNEEKTEDNAGKEQWKPISLKQLKTKLTRNLTHKCTVKGCLYKFESTEKRDIHLKCHCSVENIRNFKCPECGEGHKSWRTCGLHMWKEHKIDVDMLKCPLCNYKVLTTVQIFRHLQSHGPTRGFACTMCPKTFSQYSKLRYHSINHLDKKAAAANRWYSKKTCDICLNVFANSKTLSKHVSGCHNQIMSYRCNICGKQSTRKATWLIHLRQHTGEKPFHCEFPNCQFMARDPSVLRKHRRRHSQTKPYKCKHCSYSAIQTEPLKTHIRTKHPEEYMKMKCDQCSFISINNELLQRHMKDHKAGLVKNEEHKDVDMTKSKIHKSIPETSSDCFLPLESTDSMQSSLDTGGVTIPAHSEDTQFPLFNE